MCLQTSLKPFVFLCPCPLEQGLHFFTVLPRVSSFEKTQKGCFFKVWVWKYAPRAIENTPLTPSPFHHRQYGQTFAQRSPLGNGKVSVTYRVTAILKQVNCAENITQLKILGSCPVTAIYSVTGKYCIFILACITGGFLLGRGESSERQIHETELQNFWLFPPHSPCCSTGLSLRDALAAGRILKSPFSPCPRAC